VTALESALHTLAIDELGEPAPANLADRALTRARQRTRRRGALSVVGAATVAVLVAVGVTTVTDDQRRTSAPPVTTPAFVKPRVNVLVIGSDAAPGGVGARPDTIMVASVDTVTGDSTLISFARNLVNVRFPAGTPGAEAWPKGFNCGPECTLRSVWTWAESNPGYQKFKKPGLAATTHAIEHISGLDVDETVVLTMQGLVDLVDAVGGVTVTVKERLPIGGNSDRSSPDYHKATGGWIEAGPQHLDGRAALWFARSVWTTDDDSERMRRQRCLITTLAKQVDGRTLLTGYAKIARSLKANLHTSIAAGDLADWVKLLGRMRDARIQRLEFRIANWGARDQKIQETISRALAHHSHDPHVAWDERNANVAEKGAC
jgi:LCP family protein required for cell wall assembly